MKKNYTIFFIAFIYFVSLFSLPIFAVGDLSSVTSSLSSYSLGATNVTATFNITLGSSLPQGQFIEVQFPSIIENQPDTTTINLISSNPVVGSLGFASIGNNPDTNSIIQNGVFIKTSGASIPAGTTINFTIGGLTNSPTAQADSAGIRTVTSPSGSAIDGDSNNSMASYRFQTYLYVGALAFSGTVTNNSSAQFLVLMSIFTLLPCLAEPCLLVVKLILPENI